MQKQYYQELHLPSTVVSLLNSGGRSALELELYFNFIFPQFSPPDCNLDPSREISDTSCFHALTMLFLYST